MGATGWSYFVPYQSNIQQALQDLQNWVLQNDDYFLLETREEAIKRIEKEWLNL